MYLQGYNFKYATKNIDFLNYQNNNQNSQYLQDNKQKNKAKNLGTFYMYATPIYKKFVKY